MSLISPGSAGIEIEQGLGHEGCCADTEEQHPRSAHIIRPYKKRAKVVPHQRILDVLPGLRRKASLQQGSKNPDCKKR